MRCERARTSIVTRVSDMRGERARALRSLSSRPNRRARARSNLELPVRAISTHATSGINAHDGALDSCVVNKREGVVNERMRALET